MFLEIAHVQEITNFCIIYFIINIYMVNRKIYERFNSKIEPFTNPSTSVYRNSGDLNMVINEIQNDMGNIDSSLNYESIPFDTLEQIEDPLARINFLMEYIEIVYRYNTVSIKDRHNSKMNFKNSIKIQTDRIKSNDELIKSHENMNATKYRKIQNNIYNYNKVIEKLNVLKIAVITAGILLVIPLLGILNLIPKYMALGVWFVVVLGLLGFAIYRLQIKNINRDDLKYSKFNFGKPDGEQISRSRAHGVLSKEEQAQCRSLTETEDDPTSRLGDMSRYINRMGVTTCASGATRGTSNGGTTMATSSTTSGATHSASATTSAST